MNKIRDTMVGYTLNIEDNNVEVCEIVYYNVCIYLELI